MKSHNGIRIGSALAVAVLASSVVSAQQEKVADQDLLNMLDKVNNEAVSTPEVAVEEVVVSLDVVDETVTAPETTMDAESTEVVDDLSVQTIENEIAPVEAMDADAAEVVDDLSVQAVENAEASSEGNLISVRLTKVGLEDAINLFAELSGANIIVPELTEASQISVSLKDVEWRPALQSILDTYNYELYQRVSGSNVYAVRRRPAGSPEPQVVETFKLEYATVPNAALLIRDLLPADAKISEFASRNMMVIKSTESSLGEVRAVLNAIDVVRQQVYIESKFMELTDDAQKSLGIDWSVLSAYGVGTDGGPTYTSTTQKDKNNLLDVDGNKYNDASGYLVTTNNNLASSVLEGLTPSGLDASSQVLTSVLDADEFRVVMSALEQDKGVNIVSNPKIIVANEELANISIIRKEPNLKQEREQQLNDQPATTIFTLDPDLPFFEYGIKLDVTPSVNTSSNITVKIQPSLTRKYADKIAGDNTYPIIDEKTINTVFSLASGQTAAIGGLTEVTEGEEERKVPVLGSIPFIGRLFSWKQTVKGQDETVIFVTVGLANIEQLAAGSIDMPGDAELARRQLIIDANHRILRDQGREYFEAEEQDKLDSMLKLIDLKEKERDAYHQKQQEKDDIKMAKREAKLAE